MGERFEVNHSIGSPAVVRVEDEVAVEVTSIESREWESIPWGAKWLFFFYFVSLLTLLSSSHNFLALPPYPARGALAGLSKEGLGAVETR